MSYSAADFVDDVQRIVGVTDEERVAAAREIAGGRELEHGEGAEDDLRAWALAACAKIEAYQKTLKAARALLVACDSHFEGEPFPGVRSRRVARAELGA